MRAITIISWVLLGLFSSSLTAAAYEVGQVVELKATKPIGVPLHRQAKSSLFGRAQTGTKGTIFDTAKQGRWLHLALEDGRTAWIVEKYVARAVEVGSDDGSSPGTTVDPSDDELAVWSSPSQCEAVVNAGRRMANTDGTLRIATWASSSMSPTWWPPRSGEYVRRAVSGRSGARWALPTETSEPSTTCMPQSGGTCTTRLCARLQRAMEPSISLHSSKPTPSISLDR